MISKTTDCWNGKLTRYGHQAYAKLCQQCADATNALIWTTPTRGRWRKRHRWQCKCCPVADTDNNEVRAPTSDLCYYHHTFNRKVCRCVKPCAWSETSRLDVCSGHSVQLKGWPTICMGQGLWRSVPSQHWSISAIGLITHTKQTGTSLVAASRSTIKAYWTKTIPLCFTSKQYNWDFTIAEVSQSLLSADFLRANLLLVDLKGKCLVDAETYLLSPLCQADALAPHLSTLCQSNNEYNNLLSTFSRITMVQFAVLPTENNVEHFIMSSGSPNRVWAHRLPSDKLNSAKAEFNRMQAVGIIWRSNSPWASPLHMVRKASGGWHPCGVFGCLNDVTILDLYPVPHI